MQIPRPIPLWFKIIYTAFMAVLVPVYWIKYGPTNFLYFCDAALFLTLIGIWRENALLISMCAVGILLPQTVWCVDYLVELLGGHLTSMTGYMLDAAQSRFLRSLSLFHGWMPFMLVYLLTRTGYDRRALYWWTAVAWALCLICYFLLPGPADVPGNLTPRNVNYVYGLKETVAQTWVPAPVYLVGYMVTLFVVVFVPTHLLLKKLVPAARDDGRVQ